MKHIYTLHLAKTHMDLAGAWHMANVFNDMILKFGGIMEINEEIKIEGKIYEYTAILLEKGSDWEINEIKDETGKVIKDIDLMDKIETKINLHLACNGAEIYNDCLYDI